jgi:hypothetical protein
VPISVNLDPRLGIIREMWVGKVSAEDVREHWTRLLTDPEALALRASLADLREASLDFGGWQMRRLIDTVVTPLLHGRDWITAMIVAGPLQLGMTRQYQDHAEHFSRDAIFFNEHDALEWLVHQRAGLQGHGRSAPWGDGWRTGEPH